jgi:antitoxin component of RelBE/YafQ-DinJ toxin-antitoxin module
VKQRADLCTSKTASIRARIEPGLKIEVENILSDLGLTVS